MSKLEKIIEELQAPEYAELVERQDYPAIASQLNRKPLINNPEPQATVPKVLTREDAGVLFNLLSDELAFEIGSKLPGIYERLNAAFSSNDREMIFQNFKTLRILLPEELKTTIESYLNQTQLDPNYQPQIQGASRAEVLGISVDEHDVQAALNPMGVLENAIVE